MSVLITGVAGFIGYHFAKKLFQKGIAVIGLDNLNPYYDVNLKKARLNKLNLLSSKLSIDFDFFEDFFLC